MAAKGTYNRRERPAKPALTRDGIIATALTVMRAEGVERVTMRRLAQELDTGAASLYVYVKDTEELHAAILDELLAGVTPQATGDWRDRLWTVLSSYRDVLLANPSLARVALVTRLNGPYYLAVVEAVLALLDEGGMDPGQAAWAVDLLLLMSTAAAVEHGTHKQQQKSADQDQDELAGVIRGVNAERYPHIAALSSDLVSGPPAARSRWAFDALLNGALGTPRPPVG